MRMLAFTVTLLMFCCLRCTGQQSPILKQETLAYRHPLSGPLAFSPDGRWLACATRDDNDQYEVVLVCDMLHRRVARRIAPPMLTVYSITFSPDSQRIAIGQQDPDVLLWSVNAGKLLHTLKGAQDGSLVHALQFTPDGRSLGAVTYHGILEFWQVESGKRYLSIDLNAWRGWNLSIAPDGSKVAVGLSEPTYSAIEIYSLRTGHRLQRINVPTDNVAYSPDGKHLAIRTEQTLELCKAGSGRLEHLLAVYPNSADRQTDFLAFLPGGKTLVDVTTDLRVGALTVRLWSVGTGQKIRTLRLDPVPDHDYFSCAALSPDGKILAYIYRYQGLIRLLDLQQHEPHELAWQARIQ